MATSGSRGGGERGQLSCRVASEGYYQVHEGCGTGWGGVKSCQDWIEPSCLGRMDWEGLTMARLPPTTTHAPALLCLALSSVRPWGQSPRQASSAWSPPPWLRLHGQFPPLGGCILGSCSGCLDPLLLTSPFSLTPGAAFPKSCLGPPHHPEGGPLELGCPWPCRGR